MNQTDMSSLSESICFKNIWHFFFIKDLHFRFIKIFILSCKIIKWFGIPTNLLSMRKIELSFNFENFDLANNIDFVCQISFCLAQNFFILLKAVETFGLLEILAFCYCMNLEILTEIFSYKIRNKIFCDVNMHQFCWCMNNVTTFNFSFVSWKSYIFSFLFYLNSDF